MGKPIVVPRFEAATAIAAGFLALAGGSHIEPWFGWSGPLTASTEKGLGQRTLPPDISAGQELPSGGNAQAISTRSRSDLNVQFPGIASETDGLLLAVDGEKRQAFPELQTSKAPQTHAYITSAVEPVMAPLEAIVRSKVAEVGIPLQKIEWTVFKYKDRKRTDLILRLFVRANRSQALAFWEHLGSCIDEWVERLPQAQADVLLERLSTEVVWS